MPIRGKSNQIKWKGIKKEKEKATELHRQSSKETPINSVVRFWFLFYFFLLEVTVITVNTISLFLIISHFLSPRFVIFELLLHNLCFVYR